MSLNDADVVYLEKTRSATLIDILLQAADVLCSLHVTHCIV